MCWSTELDDLQDFATIANRKIFKLYGARDSCAFSTAVVCDALAHFGAKAEPLGVTTAIFPVNHRFAEDQDRTERIVPASSVREVLSNSEAVESI
jgi:hypothetical protein